MKGSERGGVKGTGVGEKGVEVGDGDFLVEVGLVHGFPCFCLDSLVVGGLGEVGEGFAGVGMPLSSIDLGKEKGRRVRSDNYD